MSYDWFTSHQLLSPKTADVSAFLWLKFRLSDFYLYHLCSIVNVIFCEDVYVYVNV